MSDPTSKCRDFTRRWAVFIHFKGHLHHSRTVTCPKKISRRSLFLAPRGSKFLTDQLWSAVIRFNLEEYSHETDFYIKIFLKFKKKKKKKKAHQYTQGPHLKIRSKHAGLKRGPQSKTSTLQTLREADSIPLGGFFRKHGSKVWPDCIVAPTPRRTFNRRHQSCKITCFRLCCLLGLFPP